MEDDDYDERYNDPDLYREKSKIISEVSLAKAPLKASLNPKSKPFVKKNVKEEEKSIAINS